MKMHSALILTLVCIALAVGSCGNARYDSRLLAADSIINSAPDSALSMLRAVPQAEIPSAADRAFYALLVTQAGYKCDEPIKSTDTIDRAIKYFTDSRDREKRTRSLIYKGAVLDELGDKTAAMLWYKQAEEAADPHDYFNLGYVNLRMARVYQDVLSRGREYIEKQKRALHYFTEAGEKHYQLVCMTYLGAFYRLSDLDSASVLVQKSIALARQLNDSVQLFTNYEIMASIYGEKFQYGKQKDCALYAIKTGTKYIDSNMFFAVSRAYAKLGMPDSAEHYLKLLPEKDADIYSYTSRLMTLTNIAVARKDYKTAYHYRELDFRISDSLKNSTLSTKIMSIEQNFDRERDALQLEMERRKNLSVLCVSVAIMIILGLIIMNIRSNAKKQTYKLEATLSELRNDYAKAELIIKSVEHKNDSMRKLLNGQFRKVKEVLDLSENIETMKPNKVQQKIKGILASKMSESEVCQLIETVNLCHDNILEKLEKEYVNLDEDDIKQIALMLCGFSNTYICFFMGYSSKQYVINRRLKISKKMGIDIPLQVFLKSVNSFDGQKS